MTGFLKRDFYLISGTLRFYILLIGLLALFATFSDFNISFLSLYMVIFAMSGMMGLFSYDDMNRWQAYGAAVPAGRRAMVDARCLLAVLLAPPMVGFPFSMPPCPCPSSTASAVPRPGR